ncbi:hypothetical protein IMCC9480_1556 [Oxalobacteraceae bacterium IMCC9480]|nr:hypothetical protein IMCC9480_1556 [Oxalobacteraceae bacterium IMCC9480]
MQQICRPRDPFARARQAHRKDVADGPLVIITMQSDSSTASSTSCVTITMVDPVVVAIFNNSSADAMLDAAGNLIRALVFGAQSTHPSALRSPFPGSE